MRRKRISKAVAMACAITLTASTMYLSPDFKYGDIPVVNAVGGADGTTGDAYSGNASEVSNGYSISGDTTGYRIYLAPNRVWLRRGDTEEADIGITTESVNYLSKYHGMALYEMSCQNIGGTSCACAINDGRASLSEYYVESGTKTLQVREVGANRILSRGTGDNQNPTFNALFEGITADELPQNTPLKPWGSFYNMVWDFETLASWSNERFSNIGEHSVAIDKFLRNYKNIIGDDILWTNLGYPDDYYDFIYDDWCIVVEPICTISETNEPKSYAVSYQDYLCLELGDPVDNGISNSNGTDMTYFDYAVGGNTWEHNRNKMFNNFSTPYGNMRVHTFTSNGKNRLAMMAAYYADFKFNNMNDEEVTINTAPQYADSVGTEPDNQLKYLSSNLKSCAPTAGFAVYTDYETAIFRGTPQASANENYWIMPYDEYQYASPSTEDSQISMYEFSDGDGQVSDAIENYYVDSFVADADVLATKTSASDISKQTINSKEYADALSSDGIFTVLDSLSNDTDWINKPFNTIYPAIRFFEYQHAENTWGRVKNFNKVDAKALDTEGSMGSSAPKIVAGMSGSAISEDYYLKTFYSVRYPYAVNQSGVSVDALAGDFDTNDYTFYVYPDSTITTNNGMEAGSSNTFYAGSKYTVGIKADLNSVGKHLDDVDGIVVKGKEVLISPPSQGVLRDNPINKSTAWKLATEMSMYGLANSKIIGKASTGGMTLLETDETKPFTQGTAITNSVEIMFKDTLVTSYVSYGGKDVDGNVYSGKYSTLTEDGIKFTDAPMEQYTYSVVDAMSNDDNDIVTIKNTSQTNKPVFVIAIPNSESGAYNYSLEGVAESNFYGDFFKALSEDVNAKSLNSVAGVSRVARTLTAMGINKDTCIVKLVSASDADNEVTKIALGAYGGSNGSPTKLMGYSIYVLEDSEVGDVVECEGSLKPYELNYVYPTILCETGDEDLIPFYVAKGDTVNIKKTDEYAGDIISFHKEHGLTLIDMIKTGFEFAKEATDPKTFTFDTVVHKAEDEEWVKCERGYSYLTHSVNLTKGMYGEAPVVSSLRPRDEYFTEDVLNKMGLVLGNKGRENITNIGEYIMGTTVDKFRWSADKGLPLILGGQLIEVTPFGDGQPMHSAGYDLSTKAYAYNPVDRGIGGSVEKGIVDGSLVVPSEGSLSYKLLTSEQYDDVLKFYPEYQMVTYKFNEDVTDGDASKEAEQTFTYVMADKPRHVNPAGLYQIAVRGATNAISGKTLSDTVATGSGAKALSQKFGGLQVVYAGSNINMTANTNFSIDLSGFVLDQIDKSIDTDNIVSREGLVSYNDIVADGSYIKQVWGNDGYDAKAKYEAWLSEVKTSIGVDVSLTTYNGASVVNKYTGYNTSVGRVTGGEITGVTTYLVSFMNGDIVEDYAYETLIKAFAMKQFDTSSPTDEQLSQAKEIFRNSDIFASIVNAVESSSDDDNTSSVAEIYGNRKWYDEEVHSFVIREYHTTPVKIENVLVSDKIDINAGPSQTGSTASSLFSNGYLAKWGMTIYLNTQLSTAPDMVVYNPAHGNLVSAMGTGSVITNNVPISGADFVISDATTADASY